MERSVRILTGASDLVPEQLPYPFTVAQADDEEQSPGWDQPPPDDTRTYALPQLDELVAQPPQEPAVWIMLEGHGQLTDPQVVAAAHRALEARKDVTVVVHDG